jgi:hypothetical protein
MLAKSTFLEKLTVSLDHFPLLSVILLTVLTLACLITLYILAAPIPSAVQKKYLHTGVLISSFPGTSEVLSESSLTQHCAMKRFWSNIIYK